MNRVSDVLPARSPMEAVPAAYTPQSGRPTLRLLAPDATGTLIAATGVAVAYAAAARFGAKLVFPGAPVSALWFPNAILLAALLLAPRRDWWVYLVLVLPAHLLVQPLLVSVPPAHALIGYVGNCGTALMGAWLLRAYIPGRRRIDRIRTAVIFIVLVGALVPICTSALMAAAAVVLHVSTTFWLMAAGRSLTNAFAVLTLVPLILHGASWVRQGCPPIRTQSTAEACLLLVTLVTVAAYAFVAPRSLTVFSSALEVAPFVILLWAAVRFGVVGACGSVLVLGVLATWGTLHRAGTLIGQTPGENVVSLLLFLVLTGVSLLLLAAALEERRTLEQENAATEARFRTIFEHNLMPIVIWRSDGRIVDANTAFFRLTCYERAALCAGQGVIDALLAPSVGAAFIPDATARPGVSAESPPLERELIASNGRRIPVLVGGCRFPGSTGETMAYVFDLSALRHAEAGRRGAELLHSAVLASVHGQIAVLDRAGVILEVNDSWQRFIEESESLPIRRAHVGGNYLEACALAAERGDGVARELAGHLREVLEGLRARGDLEFSRATPDGLRWYEISIERLRRLEGGAVVTRADVTARRQAIEQARTQRQQLAHLGRAAVLGELSGAFAHELAQPLTAILGNAEAALQLLPADTPGRREIADILRDIIRDDVRAAEMMQRLRSMLARGEIERKPVELSAVVRDVLALTRGNLLAQQVSVTVQLDPPGVRVLADPVQLQQVLLNLILNACEAMAESPVTGRRLSIAARPLDAGRTLECSVTDCGSGIEAADAERIFQPFVTTKKRGLGLGLAICRSIIEAHGGRMWAENAAGHRGAIFRFTASSASGSP
jgi:PAS domain S-box-containing protein